jgi:hypothetical protein
MVQERSLSENSEGLEEPRWRVATRWLQGGYTRTRFWAHFSTEKKRPQEVSMQKKGCRDTMCPLQEEDGRIKKPGPEAWAALEEQAWRVASGLLWP